MIAFKVLMAMSVWAFSMIIYFSLAPISENYRRARIIEMAGLGIAITLAVLAVIFS